MNDDLLVPCIACGACAGEPCKDVAPDTVHGERRFMLKVYRNASYGCTCTWDTPTVVGHNASTPTIARRDPRCPVHRESPAPARYSPFYSGLSRDRLEEYATNLEAQLTATQTRCTELLEETRKLREQVRKLETRCGSYELSMNEAEAQRDAFGQKALALQEEAKRAAHVIAELESGINLPGWMCSCGTFNGAAKVRLLQCRFCDKPKPR